MKPKSDFGKEIKSKISPETKIDQISDKLERLDVAKPRPRSKLATEDFSDNKTSWGAFVSDKGKYIPTMPKSVFKKFFIGAFIFFIFSVVLVGYKFFISGNNTFSNDLVDLSIVGSSFIPGGQDLPLTIEVANRNPVDFESAVIFLEYPKGSDDTEKVREEYNLGVIKSGQIVQKEVTVVLYGEQNSSKKIEARLEYRAKDSNAIIKKSSSLDVTISEVPVSLSMVVPEKISANQTITLRVNMTLNGEKAPKDLALLMNYPIGFEFQDSTPKPSSGNNIFDIPNIKQGQTKEIVISGKILGEVGEERSFHASVGEKDIRDSSRLSYSFNSTSKIVAIDSSAIAVRLSINGTSGGKYIASSKENIIGVISWSNNTDKVLRDLEIKANMSGSVYVDENVTTASGGFFDSATDSILWDKNSVDKFASVMPGDSGTVSFSIRASNLITTTPNPKLNFNISIRAKDPSVGNALIEANNQEVSEVVYSSNLQFAVASRYRGGPIVNSGPLPPKAEQRTTYTITWSLTNTSNQLKNGTLITRLPPYMNFVGNSVPQNEALSYNASTREVTWNIGDIEAYAGISGLAREVSFQVELRPSISQIGTQPVLVYESTIKAVDRFTNVELSATRAEVTTNLVNDIGFQTSEASVVP